MLQKIIISLGLLLSLIACDPPGGNDVIELSDLRDTVVVYVDREVIKEVIIEAKREKHQWYVDTLRSYLGSKELNGSNQGPDINVFFRDCNIDPGVPWCACFTNYGLFAIGGMGPATPAWSPSWFPKSKTVYTRGVDPDHTQLREGWVFGVYFPSKKRIAHVGVIVEDLGDGYVLTIEGNTNSANSREGNGVYLRIRHKSEIYKCADWL